MSFKVKINQYGGEMIKIGTYKRDEDNTYKYLFTNDIDPDQKFRSHAEITKHLKIYVPDIDSMNKQSVYFPSNDNYKTGNVMIPKDKFEKQILASLLNYDDVSNGIDKLINSQVSNSQLETEKAKAKEQLKKVQEAQKRAEKEAQVRNSQLETEKAKAKELEAQLKKVQEAKKRAEREAQEREIQLKRAEKEAQKSETQLKKVEDAKKRVEKEAQKLDLKFKANIEETKKLKVELQKKTDALELQTRLRRAAVDSQSEGNLILSIDLDDLM
jgi:flagellar biosynthesis GTPase FlhF